MNEKLILTDIDGVFLRYLKQWEPGHWWIEDKPENAVAGIKAGHKSILITHPYNKDFEYPGLVRANGWKEIYEIVTGK